MVGEQTTSSIVIDASPEAIMAVISDFARYPDWAKGVQSAVVESSYSDGLAERVHFVLDVAPIKDSYTLHYEWDGDHEVTWSLVEGNILRALDGAYTLNARGADSTEVIYRLALDVSIPLIGMLKRKGEKILIDTALKGLKSRVEAD
jgi:ribosome-associated toxin RatA of RatAB toxin-antitoxin module